MFDSLFEIFEDHDTDKDLCKQEFDLLYRDLKDCVVTKCRESAGCTSEGISANLDDCFDLYYDLFADHEKQCKDTSKRGVK